LIRYQQISPNGGTHNPFGIWNIIGVGAYFGVISG
jgi:hypothetical protein